MADNTFTPPEGVRSAAKRALKWIADGKAGSGFTSVGHTRATQLANGENISLETLNRMKSFFSRNEVDKKATGFNEGEQGFPSHGRVAWDAWGGNAGFAWAKSKVGETEKSINKSADIAPRLVELSVDKLRSLHERLHKSSPTASTLEVHHLTTTEMARRGMELPVNDEWQNVRIQIDYFKDVDLKSFASTLPTGQIEDVIKATGTSVADVRVVLTSIGYAMEIAPNDVVAKMIKHQKDKWVVYDSTGTHAFGTYDTKEEAMDRIAEMEYFKKHLQGQHDQKTHAPIWTRNLVDAIEAGEHPEVEPENISAMLKGMSKLTTHPDITEVSVKGHLLFGGEGMGIARKDMPQIPSRERDRFLSEIEKTDGVTFDKEKVDPTTLKPIQKEISGSRAGAIYNKFAEDGGIPKNERILISSDGFVVDGHHTWAASVGFAFDKPGTEIPVYRLSITGKEALKISNDWAKANGFEGQAIDAKVKKSLYLLEPMEKFNPHHDEIGRFTTATGGGSSGATVTGNTQDGSQVVNGIKVPPLAKEPEIKAHNPVALAKAKEINETAKRVEPAITGLITAIAQRSGGEFVQLDQRIKSTEALAGKIEREAVSEHGGDLDKAAAGISDAVRYTLKVPQSEYTASFDSTIKVLQDAGFTTIRPKNFWQSGDPYDGANIKGIKNGIQIEVQLHTPESFAMKKRIHGYYEAYRKSPNDTTRKRMWTRMVNIAKTLEKPANYSTLLGIGTLVLQQFQTAQEVGLVKSTRVDILNLNKREG